MRLRRAVERGALPTTVHFLQQTMRERSRTLAGLNDRLRAKVIQVEKGYLWRHLGGSMQSARDLQGFISTYVIDLQKVMAAAPSAVGAKMGKIAGLTESALVSVRIVRSFDRTARVFGDFKAKALALINSVVFVLQVGAILVAGLVGCLVLWPSIRDLRRSWDRERELRARVEGFAYQDALTTLANRKGLEMFIDERRAEDGSGFRFGYLLIDLNGFKPVNDTFGHAAGDAVLAEIARRLKEAARESDFVARVGGDEFVVLLTDIDDRVLAERRAAEIAKIFSEEVSWEGNELEVSASIGVALSSDFDGRFGDVAAAADSAMFRGKEHEGLTVNVFCPETSSKSKICALRTSCAKRFETAG